MENRGGKVITVYRCAVCGWQGEVLERVIYPDRVSGMLACPQCHTAGPDMHRLYRVLADGTHKLIWPIIR